MSRHLHIDPFHGASGDMFLASFFDLGIDPMQVRSLLCTLKLPVWDWEIKRVQRCGVSCNKVNFIFLDEEGHTHRHLPDIKNIINEAGLPIPVIRSALKCFEMLAEAEGKVHGRPPEDVAFHEVGAMDSILDIVGSCICWYLLDSPVTTCGPIALGGGMVQTAHGYYPVPAPAVLEILAGATVTSGSIAGELTTPTGAALIATFTENYTSLPTMQAICTGWGAGSREDEGEINALRLVLGKELIETPKDSMVEISCNLDDMPPQVLPPIVETLFKCGAADVWLTPIHMKKGRPGFCLSALVHPDISRFVAQTMIEHTTTLGVRMQVVERIILDRDIVSFATPWGDCRAKVAYLGGVVKQIQPEFEDVKMLSSVADLPFLDVFNRCQMLAFEALHPGEINDR